MNEMEGKIDKLLEAMLAMEKDMFNPQPYVNVAPPVGSTSKS